MFNKFFLFQLLIVPRNLNVTGKRKMREDVGEEEVSRVKNKMRKINISFLHMMLVMDRYGMIV